MEQTVAARVTDVAEDDLPVIWPLVREYFEAAQEHSLGEKTLEDVYADLLCGTARLWVTFTQENGTNVITAAAVTEVVEYPQKRVAFVTLAGGEDMDWLRLGLPAVESWALENGAVMVAALTRKGMAKALRSEGFREVNVLVAKELTPVRIH